jgi:hypothetical protein
VSAQLLDAFVEGTASLEVGSHYGHHDDSVPRFRSLAAAEIDPLAAATLVRMCRCAFLKFLSSFDSFVTVNLRTPFFFFQAKASDLEAAVEALQQSVTDKQRNLAEKELQQQRLRLQLRQADADLADAQRGIEERMLALASSGASSGPSNPDLALQSLESRKVALTEVRGL